MNDKIRGKVAKVLSDSQIALNIGSTDGVKAKAKGIIWQMHEIKDPDTEESLGDVLTSKLNFEITHVEERLSIGNITSKVASSGTFNYAATIPIRKRVTTNPEESTTSVIFVAVGDHVSVDKIHDKWDEPPF